MFHFGLAYIISALLSLCLIYTWFLYTLTWLSSNGIGVITLIFNNHSTLYLYNVLNSKSLLSLLLHFITNM